MNKTEIALDYFGKRYHCSQAVIAAYHKELGLTEEQALKLGSCFGSGMRKGEVCGACTGALMVLGLKYGFTNSENSEERNKANEVNDDFLNRFREENGSYICNDLLGFDISTTDGLKAVLDKGLFRTFCPRKVESAMKILEEIIKLHN